jgi:hypothetical protein
MFRKQRYSFLQNEAIVGYGNRIEKRPAEKVCFFVQCIQPCQIQLRYIPLYLDAVVKKLMEQIPGNARNMTSGMFKRSINLSKSKI